MCYRYEYYNFSHGKFDEAVDCTYVLLMENSPREETILNTLSKYKPTSKCIIQYNEGYKKCHKELKKQTPNNDLVHCLKTAFRHALLNGYKRILVLEDDCEFDERINDVFITSDICQFINEHNPDIYSLGSIFLMSPLDILFSRHCRMYALGMTHAVIYNHTYMSKKQDTDFFMGAIDVEPNLHWSKFTYHKPIAYQTMPDTENSKLGWHIPGIKKFTNMLLIDPLQLKTRVQPGFDYLYLIFKVISFLLVFLIVLKFTYYRKK